VALVVVVEVLKVLALVHLVHLAKVHLAVMELATEQQVTVVVVVAQ
jgi:hypothetical protein